MKKLFGRKTSKLDEQIDRLLLEMNDLEPNSQEYVKALVAVERLMKLQGEEHRAPVSWDTIAIIGGNLLGILIIVAYEQKHVVTSKALGMIPKAKNGIIN